MAEDLDGILIIYGPHEPDPEKLKRTILRLESSGPPQINVVFVGSECFALDGTHRLPAAQILGVKPQLLVLEEAASLPADIEPVGAMFHPKRVADVIPYLQKDYPYEFEEPLVRIYSKP